MNHFRYLILNMGSFGNPLYLGQVGDGSDKHIHQPGFACPIIGTVMGGESIDDGIGKFGLSIEKYPFFGDKR